MKKINVFSIQVKNAAGQQEVEEFAVHTGYVLSRWYALFQKLYPNSRIQVKQITEEEAYKL